ncbi:MAG: zf-HC2 domain-containing protein [Bacteroidota bacterium]
MDCDKIQYFLVGLREGTLSPEEREMADNHVAACARCGEDLKVIDEALESLRNVDNEEVPNHYFTNLLPRIRQRLEQRPERAFGFSGFALPAWMQRCLAPVSAGAVLSCMIALYILCNPIADTTQLPLKEIVAELPREEVDGVAESMSYSNVLARTMEPSQRLMETLSNPGLVSQHIERELVEDQLQHGHSLSIFLGADHPFEDVADEDVDSVIKKLNDASL